MNIKYTFLLASIKEKYTKILTLNLQIINM